MSTLRARPIIAIDGPAGAGKSNVARLLAKELGYTFVDTGALYRAVALIARREQTPWSDAPRLGRLAARVARGLSFEPGGGLAPRVQFEGADITEAIRAPDIGAGASAVSGHLEVREALLDLQRRAGMGGGVVLEGRDIGTVVFPDAEIKFFLTARSDVRAQRRFDELLAKGARVDFAATLEEVHRRDQSDMLRPVAPLRQAEGAVVIDCSDLTLEATVTLMASHVRAYLAR